MIVGIPTEMKPDESRVAIAPVGVEMLTEAGPGLAKGINIREGKLVCKAVGDAFGIPVVA